MKTKVLMVIMLLGCSLWAVSIPVANFSFEEPYSVDPNPSNPGYSGIDGVPPYWSSSWGSCGVENPIDGVHTLRYSGGPNPLPNPGDGEQVCFVNIGTSSSVASITSDVVSQVLPNEMYKLVVAIGDRVDHAHPDGRIGILVNGEEVGDFYEFDGASLIDAAFNDVTYYWISPDEGDVLIGGDIQIKIEFWYDQENGGWQQATFDNVRLSTENISMRTPGNGSINLPLTTELNWEISNTSIAEDYVDVYFGTGSDPNLVEQNNTSGVFEPVLENDTTYYWKIVTYEPNYPSPSTVATDVWSFTTLPATPVVTVVSPAAAVVDLGEPSIQFTVATENEKTLQWYKDGIVISDSEGIYSGTTSNTLTVYDIQQEDEGKYVCTAVNSAGSATSTPVYIVLKNMIAHLAFEDNLEDSSLSGIYDGVVRPSSENESYADGVIGRAFDFSANSNSMYSVVIPGSEVDFPEFMNISGYTFSCWIKTNQGPWAGILGMVTRNGNDYFRAWSGIGLALGSGDDSGAFWHQIKGGAEVSDSSYRINDGEWHHVAGAYDPVQKKGIWYADGQYYSYSSSGPIDVNQEFMIGNEMTLEPGTDNKIGGDMQFNGLIDDVRVYNYALSKIELYDLYAAGEGTFCITNPQMDVNGPDGVPDCIVDLFDYSVLASQWLECNLYPECYDFSN